MEAATMEKEGARSPAEEELAEQAKAAGNGSGPDGDHTEPEGNGLEGEGPDEQAKAPAIPPLELPGTAQQLSLSVGGEKPTKAEVKLRGGSIEVPGGQFTKGEVVDLVVKVRVAEVHFADHRDNQTGEVTATIRRHVMKIEGIEKVPAK